MKNEFTIFGYEIKVSASKAVYFSDLNQSQVIQKAVKVAKWSWDTDDRIPMIKKVRAKWGLSLKSSKDIVWMAAEIKDREEASQ